MVAELNDITKLKVRIMLITQGSGSLSTDFIGVHRVIQAQPHEVPATEDQAVGRASRIGQVKCIKPYKVISRSSHQERIQQLQAEKRLK